MKPAGQKAVQEAIRNINSCYDQRNLKMELADITLLPRDFNPKSPDNQILSVGLKIKTDMTNPIILTSDNGLQLKSKGIGTDYNLFEGISKKTIIFKSLKSTLENV